MMLHLEDGIIAGRHFVCAVAMHFLLCDDVREYVVHLKLSGTKLFWSAQPNPSVETIFQQFYPPGIKRVTESSIKELSGYIGSQ